MSFESRIRVNAAQAYNSFYNASISSHCRKLARVQRKFEIVAGKMTLMYVGHTVNY